MAQKKKSERSEILKVVSRKVDELIQAEYNPRELTAKQFEDIKSSIKRFGIVDPIIVNMHNDRKNIIVGGNQRVAVARELGIKEVPTVEVKLSLDQERELNVRLNKNTGRWDWDVLANGFDVAELTAWGFDEGELQCFDVDIPEDIDEGAMAETENECPKCGFKW